MHPSNLNLQVDQDFLASHNSSIVWTLVVSYAKDNVRVKDGGKKISGSVRHYKISILWIPWAHWSFNDNYCNYTHRVNIN
jgi:hypothetical protein